MKRKDVIPDGVEERGWHWYSHKQSAWARRVRTKWRNRERSKEDSPEIISTPRVYPRCARCNVSCISTAPYVFRSATQTAEFKICIFCLEHLNGGARRLDGDTVGITWTEAGNSPLL